MVLTPQRALEILTLIGAGDRARSAAAKKAAAKKAAAKTAAPKKPAAKAGKK